MQNIYPLFERNRILKKELLWSLRDYAFSYVQLEYQGYSPGILCGCDISVEDGQLVIGPGMIKCKGFVYLLMEEERVDYEPSDQMQYLRMKIEVDRRPSDYILYQSELMLKSSEDKGEDEFELCRFNLRHGAQLRDKFTSFQDIKTGYDTVNLLYADWGGLGEKTLSPAIIRYFGEMLLSGAGSQPEDYNFAYLCLSNEGRMPRQILSAYLRRRTGEEIVNTNEELFHAMSTVIDDICKGRTKDMGQGKGRHKIFVD